MQQGRRKLNGEASDFLIVHHLRSLQPLTERMMIEDDLTGIEFNDELGQYAAVYRLQANRDAACEWDNAAEVCKVSAPKPTSSPTRNC